MKKVLFIGNVSSAMKLFRFELLKEVLKKYSVWMISDFKDKDLQLFESIGVKCINIRIDRRGMNVCKDVILFFKYLIAINKIRPDICLTYTIKPNIYAGIVCKILKIKCMSTVEGLGTLFYSDETFIIKFIKILYGRTLCFAEKVFYLNDDIKERLIEFGINEENLIYSPGMGVNALKFEPCQCHDGKSFKVLTIGRIMAEKGFNEMLKATDEFHKRHKDFEWYICGTTEKGEEYWIKDILKRPWIKYFGQVTDVQEMYEKTNAVLTATYHEGMSTVCLEAGACCRPVLGSNIAGVREIIEDNITGYLFPVKDYKGIINKLEKMYQLPVKARREMGNAARCKILKEFDRKVINNIYMNAIAKNTTLNT